MIGRTIGSYRITKLLGEGGMGTVYQATDNVQREVAIKALRPQVIHDAKQVDRFRSEAMALGRLHHPNIATLFHLLEEDQAIYMVMEFVEGHTLHELMSLNGALPPRLALDILIDGLHGFEHAHSRGVIHRDIKASNLMISAEGSTKIMDFGIARMDGATRLTQTGQLIGTLPYMSPEQVRGLELDARSDIYSLGILLYELLTGRVPFNDSSDFELMRSHLEKEPPSARFLVPSLPPALDEVIAKAMAKDPAARFQSVVELREALEAIARELPDTLPSSTPVPVPSTSSARATLLDVPTAAPVNSSQDDRYATRVQGSPLPVPPVVVPPPPVVAPAPPVTPPALPVQSPASRPRWIPVLGILGGLLLLGVIVLALGLFRPSMKVPAVQAPVATARPVPVAHSTSTMERPAPQAKARVRRAVRRARPAAKPMVRSAKHATGHKAVHKRVAVAKPRPVKVRPRPAANEKAALRALIKGN